MRPEESAGVRRAYDRTAHVYAELVGTVVRPEIERPLERRLLADFTETLRAAAPGPVLDVGCGTGRIGALFIERGLDVIGIDISRSMLAVAHANHRFDGLVQGSVVDLPVASDTLAGASCWYSIIHSPPESLDQIGRELARVLRPGGHVLLGFQAAGGDRVDRTLDTGDRLISYRHDPQQVAAVLVAHGFELEPTVNRGPESAHEKTPQAFITGRLQV